MRREPMEKDTQFPRAFRIPGLGFFQSLADEVPIGYDVRADFAQQARAPLLR